MQLLCQNIALNLCRQNELKSSNDPELTNKKFNPADVTVLVNPGRQRT